MLIPSVLTTATLCPEIGKYGTTEESLGDIGGQSSEKVTLGINNYEFLEHLCGEINYYLNILNDIISWE